MNKLNILHITPHLGGGVGSVVLNWLKKDSSGNKHTIFCLDKNNNKDWEEVNNNFETVDIYNDSWSDKHFENKLYKHTQSTDIVLIHWWNHPLIYDIMLNFKFPACRLIMWNHTSGLYPPYVHSKRLIEFSDYFLFTSPVSYECKEIKELSQELKQRIDVVWSTIGIEAFENIQREKHDGFIVGFTGTVDFGKLNPHFISMSADVKYPDIKFVVCSGDSQKHLIDEATKKNAINRFSFEGRVPSVIPYLAKIDVFGYPLQPQHFGTCEQSLGEAMMAGCVPVVLNNPSERYIVKHNVTGIVANSYDEYSRAIEYLYKNSEIRNALSNNARIAAKKQYDMKTTLNKWSEVFEKTMRLNKKTRQWNNLKDKYLPYELYIESLGDYSKPLKGYLQSANIQEKKTFESQIKELFSSNSMFYSNNKGSVLQYLQFFPDDIFLKKWSKFLS